MFLWTEELIEKERRRLLTTALTAVALYGVPPAFVAVMRGHSPWVLPHFHVAIPAVLLALLPVAYLVMPLADGVLVLGSVRPTTPRAALLVRCVIVEGMALISVYLFLHSDGLLWPALYWAAGLPAAVGIIRRIGAYQRAMERIATGQHSSEGRQISR